ncbi:MAG: carbon monoxide dehydrogenase [Planctomycetes bacterium]|nr:carbon monoxide dehydrogenase [Planctomycetota bacterium]
MKIAVSGKGGVGKTTLSAGLALAFAQSGRKVFAIDADPACNLAAALGCQDRSKIVHVGEMKELIRERTGAPNEGYGVFFKMNPQVADLPEKLSLECHGVRVMTVGGISKGGGGCACPQNVFLKSLLSHLIVLRDEVVIVDMEAGIEHLGRATVKAVSALLVVVEPGRQSVQTALRVRQLASDVGIEAVYALGNKVRVDEDEAFMKRELGDMPVLAFVPYSPAVAESDFKGLCAWDQSETLRTAMTQAVERLEGLTGAPKTRRHEMATVT